MPMLIRSPEQIFREEKKDVYAIYDTTDSFGGLSPGHAQWKEMIEQWVEENLPGTKMETIGPSEYSGFITGGPTGLRIDFTPEGLQKFVQAWEDETGKSRDERFQCYLNPYETWFQKHGHFVPTQARPHGIGSTVWWYTPVGFIHHQLHSGDKTDHALHPANPRDIWAHVTEQCPELIGVDPDKLTSGHIIYSDHKGAWTALYTPPGPFANGPTFRPTEEQIREWFNLPVDAEVCEDDW